MERLWRTVKYEDVYLKSHATVAKLTLGLGEYFTFYNGERPHQALAGRTPAEVYTARAGGGARFVDHFRDAGLQPCVITTGQRHAAASATADAA